MQLRKHYHKMTRDLVPCAVCQDDKHSTKEHGKTEFEIVADKKSRQSNPQDKNYNK